MTPQEEQVVQASCDGDTEKIKVLLETHEIPVTFHDNIAIQMASFYGHLDTVKFLHNEGANYPLIRARASRPGHGYLDLYLKFISKNGAIVSNNNEAIKWARQNAYNYRIPGIPFAYPRDT